MSRAYGDADGGTSIGTLGETAEMGVAVPPVDRAGWAAYAAIMPRARPSTPQSSATTSPRALMRHNLPSAGAGGRPVPGWRGADGFGTVTVRRAGVTAICLASAVATRWRHDDVPRQAPREARR